MSSKRIGIVGIENSHAHEIIRYLNIVQPADLSMRVTALVAGTPERTRELAELGGIDTIASSCQELLGKVDALIVTSRDGALHRDLAVPFLETARRSGWTSRWRQAPPMLATSLRQPNAEMPC